MMRRIISGKRLSSFLIAAVAFALLTPAITLAGEKEKISGEITMATFSQYISRGQELSRHSMAVQPYLGASYGGFTLGLWGNWDSAPYDLAGGAAANAKWNEFNYTFSYGRSFGDLYLEGGYNYIDVIDAEDSQELIFKIRWDAAVTPEFTLYREVGHSSFWYASLKLSHQIKLGEKAALDISGSVSYLLGTDDARYPRIDAGGSRMSESFRNFHDGNITVGLPVALTSQITAKPTLSYVFPLTDDARQEMKWRSYRGEDNSFVVGGISLTYSF
ncbi:MAG: hypothetical protein U1C55_04195 [Smithellaceae bacterium]|nr:hypothetical protein [Smithellaceae bacterium]